VPLKPPKLVFVLKNGTEGPRSYLTEVPGGTQDLGKTTTKGFGGLTPIGFTWKRLSNNETTVGLAEFSSCIYHICDVCAGNPRGVVRIRLLHPFFSDFRKIGLFRPNYRDF